MNSDTGRNLSLEELKRRNQSDLQEAARVEPVSVIQNQNWAALLRLLADLSATQTVLLAQLEGLATREEVERALRRQEARIQTAVTALETYVKQAGKQNASFASALREERERNRDFLSELRQTARVQMVRLWVLAAGMTAFCGTLCALAGLWRG